MRAKCLIGVAMLAFASTAPALADSYYVVQDATSKRCSVVLQRPTTTTTTVVGDGKVYMTQTEAEGAMKTVTVCQSH
jgi:hypothetical protein